mmetsp:Transcript_14374/g.33933  ORF Transcript_14374/g.33933 Transcript_14374/m.33933 type:complete len:273 (+) Transcript_14374:82-900(+)
MVAASRVALATVALCAATANAFVPGVSVGRSAAAGQRTAASRVPTPSFIDDVNFASESEAADGDAWKSAARWVGAGLVAGMLAAVTAAPAQAAGEDLYPGGFTVRNAFKEGFYSPPISVKNMKNLEQCGENKKYKKRVKDEAFKLKKKQDKYAKGSAAYMGVQQAIDQAKITAKAYEGRWCGKKDGLPRVIATGEITRGGIVTPALMFLYTTGWIGYAGRTYLLRTQDPTKEVLIDVPLALECCTSSFAWPVYSWQDITAGRFVAKESELRN